MGDRENVVEEHKLELALPIVNAAYWQDERVMMDIDMVDEAELDIGMRELVNNVYPAEGQFDEVMEEGGRRHFVERGTAHLRPWDDPREFRQVPELRLRSFAFYPQQFATFTDFRDYVVRAMRWIRDDTYGDFVPLTRAELKFFMHRDLAHYDNDDYGGVTVVTTGLRTLENLTLRAIYGRIKSASTSDIRLIVHKISILIAEPQEEVIGGMIPRLQGAGRREKPKKAKTEKKTVNIYGEDVVRSNSIKTLDVTSGCGWYAIYIGLKHIEWEATQEQLKQRLIAQGHTGKITKDLLKATFTKEYNQGYLTWNNWNRIPLGNKYVQEIKDFAHRYGAMDAHKDKFTLEISTGGGLLQRIAKDLGVRIFVVDRASQQIRFRTASEDLKIDQFENTIALQRDWDNKMQREWAVIKFYEKLYYPERWLEDGTRASDEEMCAAEYAEQEAADELKAKNPDWIATATESEVQQTKNFWQSIDEQKIIWLIHAPAKNPSETCGHFDLGLLPGHFLRLTDNNNGNMTWCKKCCKITNIKHACIVRCHLCKGSDCLGFFEMKLAKKPSEGMKGTYTDWSHCTACLRYFADDRCLATHLKNKVCVQRFKCNDEKCCTDKEAREVLRTNRVHSSLPSAEYKSVEEVDVKLYGEAELAYVHKPNHVWCKQCKAQRLPHTHDALEPQKTHMKRVPLELQIVFDFETFTEVKSSNMYPLVCISQQLSSANLPDEQKRWVDFTNQVAYRKKVKKLDAKEVQTLAEEEKSWGKMKRKQPIERHLFIDPDSAQDFEEITDAPKNRQGYLNILNGDVVVFRRLRESDIVGDIIRCWMNDFVISRDVSTQRTLYAIAHNGSRFDNNFIYTEAVKLASMDNYDWLEVETGAGTTNSKLLNFTLTDHAQHRASFRRRIVFRDSYCHIAQPLAKLPGMFGIPDLAKANFPYTMLKKHNLAYSGGFPEITQFPIVRHSEKSFTDFLDWYRDQLWVYEKTLPEIYHKGYLGQSEVFTDHFLDIYVTSLRKHALLNNLKVMPAQELKAQLKTQWVTEADFDPRQLQAKAIAFVGPDLWRVLFPGKTWNLMTEITEYCYPDVLILAKVLVKYIDVCENTMVLNKKTETEEKLGINPIVAHMTTPGFAYHLLRSERFQQESIYTTEDPLESKHHLEAYKGGACISSLQKIAMMRQAADSPIDILHVDARSMYPWGMKTALLPTKPGLFYSANQCKDHEVQEMLMAKLKAQTYLDPTKITCEDDIFQASKNPMFQHGVGSYKVNGVWTDKTLFQPSLASLDSKGRTVRTLADIKGGCYHSIELAVARLSGFKVTKVLRAYVWERDQVSDTVLADFVNFWYAKKMNGDGLVKTLIDLGAGVGFHIKNEIKKCKSVTDIARVFEDSKTKSNQLMIKMRCSSFENMCLYLNKYIDLGESFDIRTLPMDKNDGLRALAKLMLNSAYGRFGLKDRTTCELIDATNISHRALYFKIKDDPKYFLSADEPISERFTRIEYKLTEDHKATEKNSNLNNGVSIPLVGIITAYARAKLFYQMQRLGPQVAYCDTDSIIFWRNKVPNEKYPIGNLTVPLGCKLGDWSLEALEWGGDSDIPINEFTSIGAKMYCKRNYTYPDASKTAFKGISLGSGVGLTHARLAQMTSQQFADRVREQVKFPHDVVTRDGGTLRTLLDHHLSDPSDKPKNAKRKKQCEYEFTLDTFQFRSDKKRNQQMYEAKPSFKVIQGTLNERARHVIKVTQNLTMSLPVGYCTQAAEKLHEVLQQIFGY